MSTAAGVLFLVAALLVSPAKILLLGTETPWGMPFAAGGVLPGPWAPAGVLVGAALVGAADRLARSARAPVDPWRFADLAAAAGAYAGAWTIGLLVDVVVIDLAAPFGDEIPRPVALCDAVGATLATAAALLALAARRGTPVAAVLGPFDARGAAAGAAGFAGLGLLLAAFAAASDLGDLRLPPLGVPGGRPVAAALLLLIEGAAAPLAEEILFRPFLYVLLARRLPRGAAAVATGLLFGLLHGVGPAAAPRVAGGILMTWLYARSGSLLPGLVVHAGFNVGLRLLPLFT